VGNVHQRPGTGHRCGTLDGVIMSGYPGTIMSTWQQAGRAGRGCAESVAALVAFQNPSTST